jgi:hypothetical protein
MRNQNSTVSNPTHYLSLNYIPGPLMRTFLCSSYRMYILWQCSRRHHRIAEPYPARAQVSGFLTLTLPKLSAYQTYALL